MIPERESKRSSLATAETASIATNSSANTFIVKSDDGLNAKAGNSNYGMIAPNKAGRSNSNLTAEAVDLIEESLRPSNQRAASQPRVSDHVHYHDSGRNSVGLGLAPPLSSLIMSSNIKVVQVSQCDHMIFLQLDAFPTFTSVLHDFFFFWMKAGQLLVTASRVQHAACRKKCNTHVISSYAASLRGDRGHQN